MTIIIDADGFSYIFSHTNRDTPVDTPQVITQQIDEFMEKIIAETGATSYVGFLATHGYTFRHLSTLQETFSIDPIKPYKGNRGPSQPEWALKWGAVINSHLRHKWKFRMVANLLEVDDAVAIKAAFYRKKGLEHAVVSNDKDLHQIPGKHYNYRTQKMMEITPEEAEKYKYLQVLTGDSVDSITGIPGVGPKTAEKVLAASPDVPTMKYLVLQEYIKHYGQREGILQFANTCNLIFMLEDTTKLEDQISFEDLAEIHAPAIEIEQSTIEF